MTAARWARLTTSSSRGSPWGSGASTGRATWSPTHSDSNAHLDDPTVGVAGRISCYLRRGDRTFLTYWTTGRGDEVMSPSFGLLDMTAYGRREQWEDSPEGWPPFPTHSFLRTDEHGAPMGAQKRRPTGAQVGPPRRHRGLGVGTTTDEGPGQPR